MSCQAKIYWLGIRERCNKPVKVSYVIKITYGTGHLQGKTTTYKRTLCSHHAKKERYKLNRKRDKGHTVEVTEIKFP